MEYIHIVGHHFFLGHSIWTSGIESLSMRITSSEIPLLESICQADSYQTSGAWLT